jgi:uncharacterized protein (TIGR04255 family)
MQHAPLELVVCQVRHTRNYEVADAARILRVRDQLVHYPELEVQRSPDFSIVMGPNGVQQNQLQEQNGWQLRSADRAWTVSLMPDFFALECTGYTRWTEFKDRLAAVAKAVEAHVPPQVETRLGLRYVDKIPARNGAAGPDAWRGHIEEHMLGPLGRDDLAASVVVTQHLAQMAGPGGTTVLLRHGTQPDGGEWPYMIDTDCWRENAVAFSPEGIVAGADQLHRLGLQVFQTCITPELFAELRGSVDAD